MPRGPTWLLLVLLVVSSGCHLIFPFGVTAVDGGGLDIPRQDAQGDGGFDCSKCAMGCDSKQIRCRAFAPSNVDVPSGGCDVVTIDKLTKIDTNEGACVLEIPGDAHTKLCTGKVVPQKTSSGKACRVLFNRLTIKGSGSIVADGPYPLILIVRNEVSIEGEIWVSGKGTKPGPGGGAGGTAGQAGLRPSWASNGFGGRTCGCQSGSNSDDCGGGGGGFGSAGANGGRENTTFSNCTTQALGGAVYGTAALVPLLGGSGGASGSDATNNFATGGGGGGALQISTQAALTLYGTIFAGGGGGMGAPTGNPAGGAGGGAGGGVLLEAAQIKGNGRILAGGGGGGGGCDLGGGAPGNNGETIGPAPGGQAGSGSPTYAAGKGGKGGTGSQDAEEGESLPDLGGAGGGGGGAGRIRLNWYTPGHGFKHNGVLSTGQVAPK